MRRARAVMMLSLGTCLFGHALARAMPVTPAATPPTDPALAEPLARAMSNRVKLWQRAGTGAGLRARYLMKRRSSMLFDPMITHGTLTFTAPGSLELRDDEPAGATTRVSLADGGALEISANDPTLPGPTRTAAVPGRRWLGDHLLALLGARDLDALRAAARLRPQSGFGYRNAFQVLPAPGHPAAAVIHDIAVQLDPETGELVRLEITEAGGDVVVLSLSEHQRSP